MHKECTGPSRGPLMGGALSNKLGGKHEPITDIIW